MAWQMVQGVKNIFESGLFSDFTIVCDGKTFNVHKAVLGPQSSFFEKAFTLDMKEKIEGTMTLPEDQATVQSMLEFAYTGTYKLDNTYKASQHVQLYIAADKYGILGLPKAVKVNLRKYLLEVCKQGDSVTIEVMEDVLAAIATLFANVSEEDELCELLYRTPWKAGVFSKFRTLWLGLSQTTPQYVCGVMASTFGTIQKCDESAEKIECCLDAYLEERGEMGEFTICESCNDKVHIRSVSLKTPAERFALSG